MRCLFRALLSTEIGNRVLGEQTGFQKFQSMIAALEPEAVYFAAQDGKRAVLIFFDLADSARIPALAEPWFMMFQAQVEIIPVFTRDELARVMSDYERAAGHYAPSRDTPIPGA